ncbi:MAG: hypothetical protein KTR29_23905 [Rhodothermaceae bacterium]|nr:hypothetical protein [Rhodothermaceae bacterium]
MINFTKTHWLFLLLLSQTVEAQVVSDALHCSALYDESGDVFELEWLTETVDGDSLVAYATAQRLEISNLYIQSVHSDSLRNTIEAKERKNSQRAVSEFLQEMKSGDVVWAVHVRPLASPKKNTRWSESEGFALIRGCKVVRHWVTIEWELSG